MIVLLSTAIVWKAVVILAVIGALAAIVLFFISKKFKVFEDPRIDLIVELLPGANCGGCGFAGCRNLAETMVQRGTMDGCRCPGTSAENNQKIASILGIEAAATEPRVAVVRCQGSCEYAPAKVQYDSAASCFFANSISAGENGCPNGCLGCGDCVNACRFQAIHIDTQTHLPVVDEKICVGCGVCTRQCPRQVLELRPKGATVFVACNNKEKGAIAMKKCKMSCIGCGKCTKVCPVGACTVENNLAHIDASKCTMCQTCVTECPKKAIVAFNGSTILQ